MELAALSITAFRARPWKALHVSFRRSLHPLLALETIIAEVNLQSLPPFCQCWCADHCVSNQLDLPHLRTARFFFMWESNCNPWASSQPHWWCASAMGNCTLKLWAAFMLCCCSVGFLWNFFSGGLELLGFPFMAVSAWSRQGQYVLLAKCSLGGALAPVVQMLS